MTDQELTDKIEELRKEIIKLSEAITSLDVVREQLVERRDKLHLLQDEFITRRHRQRMAYQLNFVSVPRTMY